MATVHSLPGKHDARAFPLLALILIGLAFAGCFHAVEEIRPPQDPAQSTTDKKAEASSQAADANDWPWWRGAERDNHAVGAQPPTTWSDTENIVWKVEVPGRGHASPVVCGKQVFVATADEASQEQQLLCYDRATGKLRWKNRLHQGNWPAIHQKNSHASATPACDGQAVYTAFARADAVWVSAIDLSGRTLWQTEAGPFQAPHGYGSSPLIYQSFVIVQSDNKNGGFLAALQRETGEIVWRVRRARNDSYGSPVVARVAGRDQLLTSGQDVVVSYDPASGNELWRCAGPSETTANTMAFAGDIVIASGGYPEQNVLAIRANGSGNVSQTHVVWNANFKMYVPSPLVIEDRLLATGDNGVAVCYSLADGEVLWKERVGAGFSASPVLIDDLVFAPDEKGVTHVFRATAKQREKIAENDLNDGGMASPVIVDGRVYLRTTRFLYCIGHTANGHADDE